MGANSNASSEESFVKLPTIKFTKLLINGEFVDSISGKTFETIDPRTGEVITRVAEGDKEDVDLAVKAARDAFDHGTWPRLPGVERRRIMMKFADLIDEHAEELAKLDTVDAGKLFSMGIAIDAGVPDGVINVVNEFGETAGAAVSYHMDIDKAAAKSNLKSVSLELGGKSPLVIFDDADVDKAADLALLGILFNKGEACVASSRVLVQEGIHDELVKKLKEKAKYWTVGDPFDPNVRQGPRQQFEKILTCIEHGKREGATLLTGGKPVGNKGYYIEPTVFTDVKDDMMIAKDEIFGPVMSVLKFKTIEEAIQRANNTKYGLAAGIITKNIDIANTVSRSIRAGTIWINCYLAGDNDAPFGGYKMSGFGKDMGMEGLHKYMHTKSVITPIYNSSWL
ncbi:hypothetical protein ACLB2K_002876 [Fragaria x ananassa]